MTGPRLGLGMYYPTFYNIMCSCRLARQVALEFWRKHVEGHALGTGICVGDLQSSWDTEKIVNNMIEDLSDFLITYKD